VTQVLPEEIDLPRLAYDIHGQAFGALTALRPIGNGRRGVLWLCGCECGRHAIRTTAALRQAKKNNKEAQCIECLRELHRGRLNHRTEWYHEFYLLHWYEHGSLYTYGQLEAIERHITQDLRAIEFPVGEPPPDVLDGHGYDQPEPYDAVSDGNNYTLSEIGVEFDLSPERVRQIFLIAARKLIHGHRRLLVSLLTGEFDWQIDAVKNAITTKKSEAEAEADPEFSGCRCKAYERSAPGYIYCCTCWRVWRVSERQARRALTEAVIRKSTIIKDNGERKRQ